uniref:sodium- and chloride-dependent neutral and basic amino acid transporter B(0+)-like isoform X2 n=1 Tax=Pristiophorus japonicus TaxID=55135 RepID=UPI00398F74E8
MFFCGIFSLSVENHPVGISSKCPASSFEIPLGSGPLACNMKKIHFRPSLVLAVIRSWWEKNRRRETSRSSPSIGGRYETLFLKKSKVVLRRSKSINETGDVIWYLALCLLLAWLIVGMVLCKGIRSSGKVVYFTATFPYLVILLLLIRGATLEGAMNGIEYYIGRQSDFSKLSEAQVWKDAATQIFYSTSVAFGGITGLSSYNRFNNNCYRDAIIITLVNCSTSVFAGFATFAILGHIAYELQKSVSEVATSETITTTIMDQFPDSVRKNYLFMIIIVCTSFYLIGLIFVTEAGIYWVQIIDHFSVGLTLLLIATLELIGIMWIYGGNRFIKDLEMMIGEKSWLFWLWWRICWFFVSPVMIAGILIWTLADDTAPKYGNLQYPKWAIDFGWCITFSCVVWIPIVAVLKVRKAKGSTLYQRFITSCRPAPDWGPRLKMNRGVRYNNQSD